MKIHKIKLQLELLIIIIFMMFVSNIEGFIIDGEIGIM